MAEGLRDALADAGIRACAPPGAPAGWTDEVFSVAARERLASAPPLLGVLPGEGIGPEVVGAALQVLAAVGTVCGRSFEIRYGGAIGAEAERACGKALSDEVVAFCRDVFDRGGAILAGPGGGRFVYELRREFDLFCKLSPLRPPAVPPPAARLRAEHLRGVDVLLVRENTAGIYQGRWGQVDVPGEGRRADHAFSYRERDVRRILGTAAGIARRRREKLAVVLKDGGIPTVSALWRACAEQEAEGLAVSYLNVDHAAYCLVQHPGDLDVVVAPNLFGDVLADLGGVLLGSRGLSYSGNFSDSGAAVYQTNHGSAYDLAGRNSANPVGQMLSLAFLLRESFRLGREAEILEEAIEDAWRAGSWTADLAAGGMHPLSTAEMTGRVVDAVLRRHDGS